MTEAEIRAKLELIRAALVTRSSASSYTEYSEKAKQAAAKSNEDLASAACALVATLLCDMHRIADAAEAIAITSLATSRNEVSSATPIGRVITARLEKYCPPG